MQKTLPRVKAVTKIEDAEFIFYNRTLAENSLSQQAQQTLQGARHARVKNSNNLSFI